MRPESVIITLSLLFTFINAQVIYVSTPLSWNAAKLDCNSRGSHLLTAQGNTADINECVNAASSGGAWIGLNRLDQADWAWTAGDVTYDANTVQWSNPAPNGGTDCVEVITNGGKAGQVTNRQISCTDTKPFCCNPVSATPTPTAVTPSPTDSTSTPTISPIAPTTAAPTDSTPAPIMTPSPTDSTSTPTVSPTDSTSAPSVSPTDSTPSPTAGTSAPSTSPITSSCPRIRKEWNTLSQSERDLYINGMLTLSAQGKLQKFTQQHGELLAEDQAHGTSAFLTWHRLFLWELETQIRNLGGQYACFGLPYWNWGKDVADHGYTYSAYSVLNSGLGSSGDASDNYCVTDGNFAKGSFTPFMCNSPYRGNDGTCCLRRRTAADGTTSTILYTNSQNENAAISDSNYGRDNDRRRDGVRENIELGPHGRSHCTMGTCGTGHLGDGRYSPDDPIFYLLHGFVDYLWAIWQDYHNYENIDKSQLSNTHYDGRLSNSGIDTELEFDILKAESWSTLVGTTYTSRDMHSIADWGFSYDAGSFINEYGFPTTNLNPTWFTGISPRRRMQSGSVDAYNFEQLVYQQLAYEFGDEADTYDGRRQMVSTLAQMTCQYMNPGDKECKRPKNFDDCSDMELGPNPYNNKMDINITLDELIEKVKDYPCMVATREAMYPWNRQVGGLWRLCRGDFDTFCDQEFLEEDDSKDQCEAKGYTKNGKRRLLEDDGDVDMFGEYRFEGLEGMIVNAGINGLIFGAVLVVVLLGYVCCQWMEGRKGGSNIKFVDENFI